MNLIVLAVRERGRRLGPRAERQLARPALVSRWWSEGKPRLDNPLASRDGIHERGALDDLDDGPCGAVHDGMPCLAEPNRPNAVPAIELGRRAHGAAAWHGETMPAHALRSNLSGLVRVLVWINFGYWQAAKI